MTDFHDFPLLSNIIEPDTEFIPLITPEDEEHMNKESLPDILPLLPIRNTVLFPGVVLPITVGRDKSIRLIHDAYKGTRTIGVVSQRKQELEEPAAGDLNRVGTIAQILRMLKMPDGSTTVIIQGKKRFNWVEMASVDPYFKAKIKPFEDIIFAQPGDDNMHALLTSIKDLSLSIIQLSPHIPSEAGFAIKNIESPTFLVNFVASNMNADVTYKQHILEKQDLRERAMLVLEFLTREKQMLELKHDIQSKVKHDIDKQQREFFLHQQMKQIQQELGDNPVDQEINELNEKAAKKKWPEKVAKAFQKEIDKLGRLNPSSPEYSVQLNFLDTLVDLPWNEYSADNFDLKRARKILDRDHSGLEKVKERILEYLAVLKLKGDMRSPILCLYGPPGVGKTSLGKSIAEALERKYVRMSLGGLHDEAEIRGHRKTYIGAMPGRVITNIKKAGTSNPVFVLDEIDKLGTGPHGDPSSALLEVLDPEQNNAFHDNYIEQEYDLSKVLFIATANNLSTVQAALRDRMEIIEVNGYTVEEKTEIAKKHLLPKQLKEHGLKSGDFKIQDKLIQKLITEYTNESGVRSLERQLIRLIRHRARHLAMNEKGSANAADYDLEKILGPSYPPDKYETNQFPGVVTGLAWTAAGGDILFIESSLTPGKGKLTLTGNLGDVMKESAMIALQYLKAHARDLKIDSKKFDETNVHIHVPEGATPKDGPSAGITILTALASAFLNKKVKKQLAMTGEITLRGKVLPVGGIKEKILAARRANIREVILCEDNRAHVKEIPARYLTGLKIHYVKNMMDVIKLALLQR